MEPRLLIENALLSNCGACPDTENLLIHGDNLLALKALEQKYTGQIKCVYIDVIPQSLIQFNATARSVIGKYAVFFCHQLIDRLEKRRLYGVVVNVQSRTFSVSIVFVIALPNHTAVFGIGMPNLGTTPAVAYHYQDAHGENGMRNIVMMYRREIAEKIYNQMTHHFYCTSGICLFHRHRCIVIRLFPRLQAAIILTKPI